MKSIATVGLLSLATGYSLAEFFVLFFNHWYFADARAVKVALITLLFTAVYFALLSGAWRKLWQYLGIYWVAVHLYACLSGMSFDISKLSFTAVLNLEAAVVWVPLGAIGWKVVSGLLALTRKRQAERAKVGRELAIRRVIRKSAARNHAVPQPQGPEVGMLLLVTFVALALLAPATGYAQEAQARVDRHDEFTDHQLWERPKQPGWPSYYPTPAQARKVAKYYIFIENEVDGRICGFDILDFRKPENWTDIGKVLAPVANVSKEGFTASGWAEPGTVCATAVNAIHCKVAHNYETGRATLFTLQPIEFADFDPTNYMSYFNASSSLFTDITAGEGIFGGGWAPLNGSEIRLWDREYDEAIAEGLDTRWQMEYQASLVRPVPYGYVPQVGDRLLIEVKRRLYNPEYIEFENSFGGLVWVKEVDLPRYPIAQVLKPVAGVGRFGGTTYADVGRIRAAHPGVIDISTSPYGVVGGFQIIPRDHAMSKEMGYTRTKTQWMVVGPLWALDPSWEYTPPLFADYLYPAFVPAMNQDGTVNEDVEGAAAFLDRFTVRGRYSDAENPKEYILLREYTMLNNEALKELTHVRVYFPRGSQGLD